MPIFEYKCRKCRENFEVLFRSRDEKMSVACPKCGSITVERLMSAFAGKIGNTSANTSAGGEGCGSCAATSCGPS